MQDQGAQEPANEQPREAVPEEQPSALIPTSLGFVLFFVLTLVLMGLGKDRATVEVDRQPVEFNHRLHVEDLELECSECHRFYNEEAFSGLPTADTCAFCHEEPAGESASEARLVELLEQGEPLEWQRLFRQPPHVFYSHSRHVAVAEIDCPACHGAFAESEKPPSRVRKLMMDDCVDCHEQEKVTTDCTACHR